MAFDALPARDLPVSDAVLAQLFTEARTRNGWSDRPVSEDLIRKLYDLTKFGPTAVNMTPARFVFITSPEAKARLSTHMAEGNRAKTLAAPVNLIIAQDIDFHETLPKLFPHAPGARDWFPPRGRLPQRLAAGRLSDHRRARPGSGRGADVGL